MLQITQMTIPDRPKTRRADVWMRSARVCMGHQMESFEALGHVNRSSRNLDHDRTLSKTRPRNQKLSTPAHNA